MRKENGKVYGVKIAYIGGGSRAWARKLMSDLVLEETINGSVALYDINEEAAKDNEIIGNRIANAQTAKSNWVFNVVGNIKDALVGADFVVLSILPNTFREMHAEVHMPEKIGVYQSVGDTAGFGGYMRAMRTAPIYIQFANDIKNYCPNAWVINYTNPMTLCTRILYEYFPEIKMFGCCHEVFGAQKVLAKAYAEITGEKEPVRTEIKTDVTGINHFTWVTKATYNGVDLFPIFKQIAEKYKEKGFYEGEDHANPESVGYCGNVVKFELFNRYGLIPAAGDRHLAEFLNGQWYLKSSERAREKRFNLTSVNWRIENKDKLYAFSKKLVTGEETVETKPSGEEGVRQIKAILGLEDLVTNVNLPNKGQIEGYPIGAVVETNALFSENSVKPIKTTPLPDELNAMIVKHIYHHEAFIKALKNKDVNAVKNIIADDPQCAVATFEEVSAVFDEIYEHNKDSLEYYWGQK